MDPEPDDGPMIVRRADILRAGGWMVDRAMGDAVGGDTIIVRSSPDDAADGRWYQVESVGRLADGTANLVVTDLPRG